MSNSNSVEISTTSEAQEKPPRENSEIDSQGHWRNNIWAAWLNAPWSIAGTPKEDFTVLRCGLVLFCSIQLSDGCADKWIPRKKKIVMVGLIQNGIIEKKLKTNNFEWFGS